MKRERPRKDHHIGKIGRKNETERKIKAHLVYMVKAIRHQSVKI